LLRDNGANVSGAQNRKNVIFCEGKKTVKKDGIADVDAIRILKWKG
jgi:hypothetical protein